MLVFIGTLNRLSMNHFRVLEISLSSLFILVITIEKYIPIVKSNFPSDFTSRFVQFHLILIVSLSYPDTVSEIHLSKKY